MADPCQQLDESLLADTEGSTREIYIPEGYELAHFTLRRVHDGHLQTFSLDNNTARLMQAVPTPAQPPVTQTEENDQSDSGSDSSTPTPATGQHIYSIPIRGPRPDNRSQGLSLTTQQRHAHSRDDGYTDVCGVFSPAKATPVKKASKYGGKFRCPRCNSGFTRTKSVKDHFPHCVSKCGNPQSLRYTDHPSMARAEANIQRRSRVSSEVSNLDMEEEDAQMEEVDEQMEWEDEEMEMNNTLVRASTRGRQRGEPADDDPHIKTEFVFGADIAKESIETTYPEHQFQSIKLEAQDTIPRFNSFRSEAYTAQTPDWQTSLRRSPTSGSSTPRPQANPWNIGVPGSAAEHAIMNMRATAPFEGYPSEAQTPARTNRDGLQGDGLDDLMDRRSYVSATPDVCPSPSYTDCVDWDGGMEE